MARPWAWIRVLFPVGIEPKEPRMTAPVLKPRTALVTQPSVKPTRKLRAAGYVLAFLTAATYAVGAIQGEEIIDQESGLEALGVLLAGGLPWVTGYFARSEA